MSVRSQAFQRALEYRAKRASVAVPPQSPAVFSDPIRPDLQQAEYRRWHTLTDDSLSWDDRRRQVADLNNQIKADVGVIKDLGLGDLSSEGATQKTIADGKAVAYADMLVTQLNAGTDNDTHKIQAKCQHRR